MRTFALVVNPQLLSAATRPVITEMKAVIGAAGGRLVMLDNGAQSQVVDKVRSLAGAEMIIALGGDGTILGVARRAAMHGAPVLGVRMGQLNFLCEVEPSSIRQALDGYLAGDYVLEPRAMLEASVVRADGRITAGVALNDLVVTKGTLLRPISTEVRVNGEHVASFLGDGVILATPTGSTAYSLSAGGPILTPDVEGILITPLCAHSVVARAMVVGPGSMIQLTLLSARRGAMLVLDGQESWELTHGETVEARRAARPALLVRLGRHSFFEVLRERLEKRGS